MVLMDEFSSSWIIIVNGVKPWIELGVRVKRTKRLSTSSVGERVRVPSFPIHPSLYPIAIGG